MIGNVSPQAVIETTCNFWKTTSGLRMGCLKLFTIPYDIFQLVKEIEWGKAHAELLFKIGTQCERVIPLILPMKGVDVLTKAWDGFTKSPALFRLWDERFRNNSKYRERTLADTADLTMSLHDLLDYSAHLKVISLAKETLHKTLYMFNVASVTLSVLNLKNEWDHYQRAGVDGQIARSDILTRAINPKDYMNMCLGVAICVAYLALTFFSIPHLTGIVLSCNNVQLLLIQRICLLAATVFTVIKHYWETLYIKPLDRVAIEQQQAAARQQARQQVIAQATTAVMGTFAQTAQNGGALTAETITAAINAAFHPHLPQHAHEE